VNTGEVIYFNASGSYDPDGSIESYFWDFGDGTNATGMTVEHAFDEAGNYTVILTVTDDDGASSTDDATKTVEAPLGLPWALFAAVGLGIAALVATAIYLWYRRRRKKSSKRTAASSAASSATPETKPVVTLYIPSGLLAGYKIPD
jgi:PKD repeat protein